jgi:hypothetical protein
MSADSALYEGSRDGVADAIGFVSFADVLAIFAAERIMAMMLTIGGFSSAYLGAEP